MRKDNVILDKSYAFALRIVKLSNYLADEKKEFVLSKQILRSGTSIGANAEEGSAGQSKKDFIAKYSIALKEARESHYWIRLLRDSAYLEEKLAASLLEDCNQLIAIIISTLKSANRTQI